MLPAQAARSTSGCWHARGAAHGPLHQHQHQQQQHEASCSWPWFLWCFSLCSSWWSLAKGWIAKVMLLISSCLHDTPPFALQAVVSTYTSSRGLGTTLTAWSLEGLEALVVSCGSPVPS